MRLFFLSFVVVFLGSISGCARNNLITPQTDTKWEATVLVEQNSEFNPLSEDFPWLTVASPTTVAFSKEYLDYLKLPAVKRENNRLLAEKEMDPYNLLMKETRQMERYHDYLTRPHLHPFIVKKPEYTQKKIGINNGLKALELATVLDPSFHQAWAAKGDLALQVGALHQGRVNLEAALLVTEARVAAGYPIPLADQLKIHRNLGWSLRNLGYFDEGLIQIERALGLKPTDHELLLLKGLLLAGAGRTTEAIKLALELPVEEFEDITMQVGGISMARSGYASLWIKSQALFAVGDYQGAMSVLGSRESLMRHIKHPLVFSRQYWTDVGLAAEMAGNEDAFLFYRAAEKKMQILEFFSPVMFQPGWRLILDYPDLTLPVYTSFDSHFFVGGSYLGFISIQMNLLDSEVFPQQQEAAARRSLNALDVAQRRNILPFICKALRGRIFHKQGRSAEAKVELEMSHAEFASRGDVDAFTSYLLGLLALNADQDVEAQVFLEEAVAHGSGDAAYYRSLGLALARQNKILEAEIVLGKALDVDSYSVPGLFNMGLLYCKMGHFEDATRVLEQAYAIDNENLKVQHLLHLAASSSRAQGKSLHSAASTSDKENRKTSESFVTKIQSELAVVFEIDKSINLPADANFASSIASSLYEKNQNHFNRKVFAVALIDEKKPEMVQVLLGPKWGNDLDPDEVVILLYADQLAGNKLRAQSLGRAILKGETGTDNPFILMLALASLEGTEAAGAQKALAHLATSPAYGIGSSFQDGYWSEFLQASFAQYRAAIQ